MAARFKITDTKGNWMTLQLSENWLDYNGMWMPDTPGQISATRFWETNPYEAENENGVPYNANLYMIDSVKRKLPVMTLQTICGNILYEKSGSGLLLWSGARALIGGIISWKKL